MEQSISCTSVSEIRSIKPVLWGNSEVNISENTEDTVILMYTILNDWGYNNYVSNSTPIVMSFKIEYLNNLGVKESLEYVFAQTSINNMKYLNPLTGLVENFDPRANSISGEIQIGEKWGNNNAQVKMYMSRLEDRSCTFYLTGLEGISNYKVTSSAEGKTVDPLTFYENRLSQQLSVNQLLIDLEENKADKTFATINTKGLIKLADIPADSTAEDISTLVADFNNLLQRLRDQNTE